MTDKEKIISVFDSLGFKRGIDYSMEPHTTWDYLNKEWNDNEGSEEMWISAGSDAKFVFDKNGKAIEFEAYQ